ncbi:MAG: type III polyketide synthase [Planctomycetota bacterium]
MDAVITGLATANPPLVVSQEDTLAFLEQNVALDADTAAFYARLLRDGHIRQRNFGMQDLGDALETDPDRLLARFLRFARSTALDAARRALDGSGLAPDQVRGLVVNTCTGYLCPGLSAYIAEDLGLAESVRHQDLMGMGCGAALPNLAAAAGMLATGVDGPVLCVAVEICSATICLGPERELVVSNSIFGDGAAAAVVETPAAAGARALLALCDFGSGLFPRYREDLRYRHANGRLRNRLSPRVPVIGARSARTVATAVLERQGLQLTDVDHWVVHPGGTVVLERAQRSLGLEREDLDSAYAVFRDHGNMSSPSVLFVLRHLLDTHAPPAGARGMLLAFGAGFSAFALFVRFAGADQVGS